MKKSVIRNSIGILLGTLAGAGVALAGSHRSTVVFGIPLFVLAVVSAYLIQWIAFIIAFVQKSEKFYDLTGSMTYISITLALILINPQVNDRTVLLAILTVIWATRLGTFLFTRIQKQGKDDRFDEIKTNFSQFLLTWTLQGLWITFTAAATWSAMSSPEAQQLGWLALVGFGVWVFGYFFELLADAQKSAFKTNPDNKGKFINSGLWAWSRHPNYFGEILIWIGAAIIAFPALSGWTLATLISPIWVIIQLTLISGIPILEEKADKHWGGQEDYEKYKKNTPVLIPRSPGKR